MSVINLLEVLKDLECLYEVKGPFDVIGLADMVEDEDSIVAVAVVNMDVKILFARGSNVFEYKDGLFYKALSSEEISYRDFLSDFLNVNVMDHDEVVLGSDDKSYILAV